MLLIIIIKRLIYSEGVTEEVYTHRNRAPKCMRQENDRIERRNIQFSNFSGDFQYHSLRIRKSPSI